MRPVHGLLGVCRVRGGREGRTGTDLESEGENGKKDEERDGSRRKQRMRKVGMRKRKMRNKKMRNNGMK